MDPSKSKSSPCPECRKPVFETSENAHLPFCGERCRHLDLSRWLDGSYVIPGRNGEAGAPDGSSDNPSDEH